MDTAPGIDREQARRLGQARLDAAVAAAIYERPSLIPTWLRRDDPRAGISLRTLMAAMPHEPARAGR